jgi:maltooligosyltrehalose trehalohydrolase
LIEQSAMITQVAPLLRTAGGYFTTVVPGVEAGDRYRFRVDGRGPFPDPASRFQPEGVHGPSEIVDPRQYAWSDQGWNGLPTGDLVIYELHVGAFTQQGTFSAAIERFKALRDLGVTAIELMPVAEFAGERNWGYDGVDFFAPTRCYGTPDDLRRLVDSAHRLGLGVILDVVYNHFGPAGNYALEFSQAYVSSRENTWGACMNLDGTSSEHVERLFIENALHWVHEYHLDGLRLDATHELRDDKPPHFIDVLVRSVRSSVDNRRIVIFAEDHRNLDTLIRHSDEGGWGLDGVWADDLHHQIRRLLSGDDEGYYRDFSGATADLAVTINQGWFYTGQHSDYLGAARGTSPAGIPPRCFIVCLQNHDQVGNRAFGDRLNSAIDLAAYRAASALLLTLPQTPLLFMGQEWASSAPFRYFTDHDGKLGSLVTEGRRREFRHFRAFADPAICESIPDPQAAATFEESKLDWSERALDAHASTLRLYTSLLALRRFEPALRSSDRALHHAMAIDSATLLLLRNSEKGDRLAIIARLRAAGSVDLNELPAMKLPAGRAWSLVLTTEDPPFAPEPAAPRIDLSSAAPVLEFARPGAVVLRAEPRGGGP